MKKLIIPGAAFLLALSACTKLDVPVESEYTEGNFPTNEASFIAATGPAYSQLPTRYAVDYWRMQEMSTDAAIIPARGGNYVDGGQYRQLHKHTWTPDHPNVQGVWEWGYGGINTCNRILLLFEPAPESASRTRAIAEMRTMRALYHFFMMDLYGNIPIVTAFGSKTAPQQSKRADVAAFIESELKAVLPDLDDRTGAITYGRPTKWMAFAILEKLYLNAPVYTGQTRNAEVVAMADSILAGNKYTLDANYISIFAPENGAQITETIFAVPYDANKIDGCQFSRFGLHTALVDKYSLPFRPSIAMSTIASYYAKFNLAGDVRNTTWLAGKQFDNAGKPITVPTTKVGLDDTYTGADAKDPINWQLEFTPEMALRGDPDNMDLGNDELAKAKGVRSVKYYPDKNANPSTRMQNNDMPVFRLADVMLMKAEAILRGAAATTVNGELQTAVVLVNKIRTRAGAPTVTAITLDELLEERARELAWEGWRRNDLIRFNKFEDSWGYKTDNDTRKRLYPIPTSEKVLNPNLVQNPGY